MKNSYRLPVMLMGIASTGLFLFLLAHIVLTTLDKAVFSENKSSEYKYLFLKLTSKPKELVAQLTDTEKKKDSEGTGETLTPLPTSTTPNECLQDSLLSKEKTDTTGNCKSNEEWIKQVIEMNGTIDIYKDFEEKEWMKKHNFIIL